MEELRLDKRHMIRHCFIGEAYPPCVLPVSRLVPIMLRELTLETQHRGRVLIVRAFSEPNRMTSIQNAIDDELGDVERLAVYNLLPSVLPNDVLPRGSIFAVKEPYYKRTADGGLLVRVDHPSDLVPLKPGNAMIPLSLAPRIVELGVSALRRKQEGNAAFVKEKWQVAVDCYSEGLDTLEAENTVDEDLRRTLHRNRAGAHLRLGHYDLTIADALAAVIPAGDASQGAAKEADIKALYRAGRAAYEMGDFGQAKHHFEQALELDTNHKETRAELIRTEKRLAEQDNGCYNFLAMAKSATKTHPRLDHASFINNTEISLVANRGRGLLATKPLKPGHVVMVEKAFHVAHTEDGGDISFLLNINTKRHSVGAHALCLYGLVDKMLWNPTLATKYLDLFDGGTFGTNKEARVVDGKVAVDTFRVQAVVDFNSFGCPRVKSGDKQDRATKADDVVQSSTGIWLRASYANHSCIPNVTRAFIGDMMVVRAVKDIRAGEEILLPYLSPTVPFSSRQKRMKDGWGFDCDCVLCLAESKVSQVTMARRARLRKEAEDFLAANPLTNNNFRTVPVAKRTKAKKLLEDLRKTYPPDLFERLPRVDCVAIGLWASTMSAGTRAQDDLSAFLDVLRDGGYFVTTSHKVTIDRTNAVQLEEAIHAATYAARALAAMGRRSAASTLEALAKEVYTARRGVGEGFRAEFPRSY
jgi:tetratricopeptide (TPR) repeat protein